jgi:cyclophilin family peptidyl-prolyl cis-trans isomerase
VFDTSAGVVQVELDPATVPGAVNNFVTLARYHYYDGTAVFRTDTSIGIVQGGSPHTQDNGDPGPGYTIPDEGFGDEAAISSSGGPYRYEAGDLVYARPGSSPDSSSGQYFFCVTDACANLDGQGIYIEFGQVVEGLDVLEAMLALDAGGAPSEEITVNSVTIEEA